MLGLLVQCYCLGAAYDAAAAAGAYAYVAGSREKMATHTELTLQSHFLFSKKPAAGGSALAAAASSRTFEEHALQQQDFGCSCRQGMV